MQDRRKLSEDFEHPEYLVRAWGGPKITTQTGVKSFLFQGEKIIYYYTSINCPWMHVTLGTSARVAVSNPCSQHEVSSEVLAFTGTKLHLGLF